MKKEEESLQTIVGEQLSSVEFVQDYLQLRFDGPVLTILTPVTVTVHGRNFRSGDPDHKDELCRLIARQVVSAKIQPKESLRIAFDGSSELSISLEEKDYLGPEAVIFEVNPNQWWVL